MCEKYKIAGMNVWWWDWDYKIKITSAYGVELGGVYKSISRNGEWCWGREDSGKGAGLKKTSKRPMGGWCLDCKKKNSGRAMELESCG